MDFKRQIDEDISIIQREYSGNEPKLNSDDFAFNYWVLTKLYNIDEETVDENITEYSDDGLDCFVFFEDLKQLYIIQNKFYGETTKLDFKYVQNEFLNKPISTLINNNYKRSQILQDIFNKYRNDSDFQIILNLYVTNNLVDQNILNIINKFQGPSEVSCLFNANIYYLNDIQSIYYNDRKQDKKNFKCDLFTINKGTVLNINPKSYDLPGMIDAKYVFTPVYELYNMVNLANNKGYLLFEENIREYLGNKGVNAKIISTLKDPKDRNNFFYYNNGITIICKGIRNNDKKTLRFQQSFEISNPQIVNGCQTVNTIHSVLSRVPEGDLEESFKNTFVMVKLLVLDSEHEVDQDLYRNIVRYNNSQNKIDEKNFEANKELYKSLQKDFEKFGFLLLIKQSDKFQYKENKNFNQFRPKVLEYGNKFGLEFSNIEDIMIPLEKLLQVLLAFNTGGYDAFTKKSRVLKFEDSVNLSLANYIKNGHLTTSDLINLYLFYLKCEKEKKESEDLRTPIPYYVIGFYGRQFSQDSSDYIKSYRYGFESKNNIDAVFLYYKNLSRIYKDKMNSELGLEYNKMIKTQINADILNKSIIEVDGLLKYNFSSEHKIINELKSLNGFSI
jgi:hypothetical protein